MKLQGSIVALVTPFHEDGTVNNEGGYRLPLCPMTDEHRVKLAGLMRQAGLFVK